MFWNKERNKMKNLILFLLTVILLSCNSKHDSIIGIQVFNGFDAKLADTISKTIKEVYGFDNYVLQSVEIPKTAFVNIKSPRYRADSLLKYLKRNRPDSIDYVLGLTNYDISTTKKDNYGNVKKPESKYFDWGVFGLGYRPGPSCVVSTFRIQANDKKKYISRLKKISIHEIGHNLGLRHCPSKHCVMQDAAESIITIDNVSLVLCENCKP